MFGVCACEHIIGGGQKRVLHPLELEFQVTVNSGWHWQPNICPCSVRTAQLITAEPSLQPQRTSFGGIVFSSFVCFIALFF